MLECLEKLIIFREGLVSSRTGHVVMAFLQFFSPECDWFLSFVPDIGIDQLFELLVTGYLSSFFKPEGFSKVFVDILQIDWFPILVIHNESSDNIFS